MSQDGGTCPAGEAEVNKASRTIESGFQGWVSLNCHVSSIEDADKLLRSHELNVHCGQSWFVEPALHNISKFVTDKG